MARSIRYVMVVRADWSVGVMAAEPSATPGLVVVANCRACRGGSGRHRHRRWAVRTTSGYRIGNRWLLSRQAAHQAAAALGALPVDWSDPVLVVSVEPAVQLDAVRVAARWGLTHAA